MNCSFISGCEIAFEDGRQCKLTYELIAEDVYRRDGELIFENYGIAICMENEDFKEYIEVPNISADEMRILNLLVLLSENQVTPATVLDVIDDWL